METTALRELLKSLCSDSEWSYAVFWKLKREGQMILEWEDCFCDYPRPRDAVQSTSGFLHHNELVKLSCLDSAADLHSVGLAVADMSSHHYIWGEGLIGKAACTDNHCWVIIDDYFSSGSGSSLVPKLQLPDEWLPQFVAGIKTILVIPVLPYGVLQLGSLKRVAENIAVVTCVKDRFYSFQTASSNHFASCKFETDISAHTSGLSIPNFVANSIKSSNRINIQHFNFSSEATDGTHIASHWENAHIINQALIPSMRLDTLLDVAKDLPPLLKGAFGNTSGFQPHGLTKEVGSVDETLNAVESRMHGSHYEPSVAKEEFGDVSHFVVANSGGSGEASDGALCSFLSKDMMKHAVGVGKENSICTTEVSQHSTVLLDCKLDNLLIPSLQQHANNFSYCAIEAPFEDAHNRICDNNLCNGEQSAWKSGEWFDEECDKGYLLEAVVAKAYAGKNGSMSNLSDNLKSSSYSESLNQCEASTFTADDSRSNVTPGFVAEAQNIRSSLTSFNSMISTFFNKEQQRKGNYGLQPKYRVNSKKKTRPGDSRKPRPRDRQLMQDYLTELRQLVPNGTKFTIDGLLEQTVKHILFLRSVTGQAEKIKQWENQKVSDPCKMRKNCLNGRSWALELGNEHPVRPIMVEDLDIPGLFLIEILCNEEGLFLDTAQVISQSGLSILKGEMEENNTDNKWAKFVVQASKDIRRMDIFWPLMQLLQGKTTRLTEDWMN